MIEAEEAEKLLERAWRSGATEVGVMRMEWSRVESFLGRKLAAAEGRGRGGKKKAGAARETEMTEQEVGQVVERAVKEVLGMGEGEKVEENVAQATSSSMSW